MSQPSGAPPGPLVRGTVIAGVYEIVGMLEDGGFSAIYEARHRISGQSRVLKVLNPDLAEVRIQVERFKMEAVATRCVSRAFVPRIVGYKAADGLHFIVMEYLHGQDLAHLLERRGRLTVAEMLRMGIQTSDALAAIHGVGLTHRDIKPENIFILGCGRTLRVKVLDFGIVWNAAMEQTRLYDDFGISWGTPEYMAPEQARGNPVDGRSDLFALGMVLYEMLTGRLPFPGGASAAPFSGAINKKPRRIREVRQDVPPLLEAIVDWTLEPKAEYRPQSASSLKYHLERVGQRNYF